MKKLISLLIGCSLGLAGAAFAQQPDEQQQPSKGKRAPQKAHAGQAQPGSQEKPAKQAGPQERPGKQTGAMKERRAANERNAINERSASNESGADKGRKAHAGRESANPAETNVSGEPTSGATNEPRTEKNRRERATQESANAPTSSGKQQVEQQRKGVKAPATAAKPSTNPAAAGTNAISPPSAAGQQNAQANAGAKLKKPAPKEIQQVKSQQANFRAQPKPQQVPSVTFNQNYRIEGSDNWQGTQYQVFRSYRPEWHDAGWYTSHYGNVVLIGGGYYFFNNGYWFPAWGYNASVQYYPYHRP